MSDFDRILDDYAKRGLLDGNAVEKLSAAHKREIDRLEKALAPVLRCHEMGCTMGYGENGCAAVKAVLQSQDIAAEGEANERRRF